MKELSMSSENGLAVDHVSESRAKGPGVSSQSPATCHQPTAAALSNVMSSRQAAVTLTQGPQGPPGAPWSPLELQLEPWTQ